MNLYLICHGMMAFWYRLTSPDGYRILIPQAPVDGTGNQMHKVLLDTTIGAPNSKLSYQQSPMGTKSYNLTFGSVVNTTVVRQMKSGGQNLALYSQPNGGPHLTVNYGTDAAPKGVAFAIDIPYPYGEQSARSETYQADPYLPGYTVNDFNIHPRQLPRSNVYRYSIADPTQPIRVVNVYDPSDVLINVPAPITADVKLYLYSGPTTLMPGMMSHMYWFNQMFSYPGHAALDLAVNPNNGRSCTPLIYTVPPFGLSFADMRHLSEIYGGKDFCAPMTSGMVGILNTDPAECVQGPGC